MIRKHRRLALICLSLLLVGVLLAVGCGPAATPTPTPSPTATPTATPAPTPTPTTAPRATPTPTAAPTATPTATPISVQQKGTLTVGLTSVEPPIFLPSESAFASAVFNSYSGVFESLFRRKYAEPPELGTPSGEGIASSWDVAPDLSKITIKIRPGVMFHKGYGELTAEDVAFSFNNAFKAGSKFGRAGELTRYMDRWEVVDKYTVLAHIKQGQLDPEWWNAQSNDNGNYVPMVSQRVFQEKGEAGAITTMVATGPFEAVSWQAKGELRAEAVKSHWRAVPRIALLRYVELAEVSTARAAFQTGEVQIIQPPLKFLRATLESVPNSRKVQVDRGTGQSIVFAGNYWAEVWPDTSERIFPRKGLVADKDHPWIGDPRDSASMEKARKVRTALAMAIDRDLVNKVALDGLGEPLYTNSGFAQGDPGWKDEWKIPYDVNQAKQLLSEAGFPSCFNLPLQIAPDNPNVITVEVGQTVAQMWQTGLGCNVKIEQAAYAARRPSLVDRSMNVPWLMQSESYSFLYQTKFHSMIPSAGFNYGVELPNDVAQPWYDNRTIQSAEQRIANNAKVEGYISQWKLFSPVVKRILFWAVRPEVKEWRPHYGSQFNSAETVVLQ